MRSNWNQAPQLQSRPVRPFVQVPSLLVCIGSYAKLAEATFQSTQQDWALDWNAANDGLGADESTTRRLAAHSAESDEFQVLIEAITRQSLQPRGFAGAELVEASPAPWVAGLESAPPAIAPPVDLEPLLPGLEERLFGQFLTPAFQQGGRLLAQWWSAEGVAQAWMLESGLQVLQSWSEAVATKADDARANSTQLWPHEAELFGL